MRSDLEAGKPGRSAAALAEAARRRQEETLSLLRRLVELESPSGDKDAVDRCMELAAETCRRLGGRVRWHRQKRFGDLLETRFTVGRGPVKSDRRPLLLLGHLDTVWPVGTLARMPFKVNGGKVFGPGALDMKAGVAMALTSLAILKENQALRRPVVLLLNSEEEVGSPVSRPVTEAIAQQCEVVFVLEPGQGPGGAYKTSRKGTGDYTVRVTGVAAHAGVDFKSGHSAVLELARQIEIHQRLYRLRARHYGESRCDRGRHTTQCRSSRSVGACRFQVRQGFRREKDRTDVSQTASNQ